jgi:hypothetical protein
LPFREAENNFIHNQKNSKMDQTPSVPPPPPPGTSLFEMDIDSAGQNHLNTISKWGKFIAITLLIIVALGVIGLATQYQQISDKIVELLAFDNKTAGILLAVVIIFIALILILLFFLLRACSLIKQGLIAQNSDRIADGFKALKVVFTIGIIFSALSILGTIFTLVTS